MATIAVLGTFDTKGVEHHYVADQIKARGHQVLMIDVSARASAGAKADVTSDEVAAAGSAGSQKPARSQDRGEAVATMVKGAPVILAALAAAGKIHGVISLGGGGGTAIATAAMRALPIGFPKLMVSTLAGGNVAPYVGAKDIVMFPSITDVAGLNGISRKIFSQAAGAICGMVEAVPPASAEKHIVVASQFGNTTQCVDRARQILEAAGYEVLVFAAVGTGGRTMESLIEAGFVAGVLDITTTEWADELAGGVLSAGPTRLEAAARRGVPAIVSTGCLDMVNFGPPETVPAKYANRLFYQHNPQVTLMRTTPDENRALGKIIAEKLNLSRGPISVMLPLRGGSVISAPGGPFHSTEADCALYESLRAGLRKDICVTEMDCNINDAAFAEACARELLQMMTASPKASKRSTL